MDGVEEQQDKPAEKKRRWLKFALCPDWPEARRMLENGASAWRVAEFLRKRGWFTEIKHASVAKQLNRFRNDLEQSAVQGLGIPSDIDKRFRNVDLAKFENFDELTKVILVQKQRIEKDLKLEQKLPKLLKDLRPEIELLFSMLERRARLAQELGMLPKAPGKAILELQDGRLAQLMAGMSDEDKARIRAQLTGVFRLGVGNAGGVSGGGDEQPYGDGGPEVPSAGS